MEKESDQPPSLLSLAHQGLASRRMPARRSVTLSAFMPERLSSLSGDDWDPDDCDERVDRLSKTASALQERMEAVESQLSGVRSHNTSAAKRLSAVWSRVYGELSDERLRQLIADAGSAAVPAWLARQGFIGDESMTAAHSFFHECKEGVSGRRQEPLIAQRVDTLEAELLPALEFLRVPRDQEGFPGLEGERPSLSPAPQPRTTLSSLSADESRTPSDSPSRTTAQEARSGKPSRAESVERTCADVPPARRARRADAMPTRGQGLAGLVRTVERLDHTVRALVARTPA